jgi:hypothetical protein
MDEYNRICGGRNAGELGFGKFDDRYYLRIEG